MGKILDYIAQETQGKCFASFKYCYDNSNQPGIEYEPSEDSYTNMKDYAEDNHSPKSRDMSERAILCQDGPPLFKFFLDLFFIGFLSRHFVLLPPLHFPQSLQSVFLPIRNIQD